MYSGLIFEIERKSAKSNNRKTSRFTNVHFKNNRWIAGLRFNKRYHALGSFTYEVDAAKAVNDFCVKRKIPIRNPDVDNIVIYPKPTSDDEMREIDLLFNHNATSSLVTIA